MKFGEALLVFVLVWFLGATLGTWMVMLGIGNLHDVWYLVPAFGFWETFSFWIFFSAALAGTVTRSSSSNS